MCAIVIITKKEAITLRVKANASNTSLITVRKRNCGEVMFFTCQSFCSQRGVHGRGGICVMGGMCGLGACVVGRCAWQGLCMVGGCVTGGRAWWGVHCMGGICSRRVDDRGDGHCSGQYASYWNAFLLKAYELIDLNHSCAI